MDNPNVVKVDSKGRVLIPVKIRSAMGIMEGTKVIVLHDETNGHFKMTPLLNNKTAEVKVHFSGQSSMAALADALSVNTYNIILSESKMIDNMTEWKILVELSEKNNANKLRDIISHVEGVENLEVHVKK